MICLGTNISPKVAELDTLVDAVTSKLPCLPQWNDVYRGLHLISQAHMLRTIMFVKADIVYILVGATYNDAEWEGWNGVREGF